LIKLGFGRHQRQRCCRPTNTGAYAGTASPFSRREELIHEFRRRLTDEERQLAEMRAQGQEWADIARVLGGTAQARRKQLERAISRVASELGLEEEESG
jgi:RNA polymerase sigma-70 factor (ECF subfamily)